MSVSQTGNTDGFYTVRGSIEVRVRCLDILEIDCATGGDGPRWTGDLGFFGHDFGLDLVATEAPFLPLSLRIYFFTWRREIVTSWINTQFVSGFE